MEQKNISQILEEIGTLLEIKGENPFKSKAYYNAARTISGLDDLDGIIREKGLRKIKGIGDAIASKIEEYISTGRIEYLENLRKEIPPRLIELLQIPNLGPKKIKVLYDTLGITNIGELEYACRENRLITLPSFGEKTQEKILKGIEFLKKHKDEHLLGEIYPQAESIREKFLKIVSPSDMEICGSIRRRKEVVKDIDILVTGKDHESITNFFISLPEIEEVLLKGDTKTSCRLKSGIEVDLRVVEKTSFPYAVMYFTGSKEHNVRLRGISKAKGFKLNEYGLFEGEQLIRCISEEEIYNILGLQYIPPELREDYGEVEAATEGRLPELIEMGDIKGIFHIHSEFSDGIDSIERLADRAKKMGMSYIGISDHSKSAYYAGGLKTEDILRQWDMIDRLNRRCQDFHIFKGIESDILPDGSLDYDEDILKGFDFVIASVHSGFNMKQEDMEKRIIRAIENPYTTMLGHLTGRLLLSRDGYPVDVKKIIEACSEKGVVIELNASPYRLDIDWRYLKYARERGVLISINPDAHSADGFYDIFYGVGIARKGWQEKKDILNARDLNGIKDTLNNLKRKKGI
ncbi:MAG TPA: DNA polymerase/3'-5' exonuclease PolX [Syntrophorhabdaceae bacterium]|nr:DNA polymerase/3'-5' exonuclease PolX [Syntrophorhabdaceae bacterium]